MIDENRKTIIPYYFDDLSGTFKKGDVIPVFDGSYFIKDIFLVDIDQNGFLDIVVVGFGSSSIAKLTFIINQKGVLTSDPAQHISMKILKHVPQPFQIFDEDSQMLISYLVVSINEIQDDNRRVVTLTKDNQIVTKNFEDFLNPDCKKPLILNFLSNEFGGAFIDLNMDCRPDLLLETHGSEGRQQEIYTFTKKGFCFARSVTVPVDYGFISFVDLG